MESSAKVLLGILGTGQASEWGPDWEMCLPELVHGDLTRVGWLLFNKFVMVVNSTGVGIGPMRVVMKMDDGVTD